MTIAVLITLKRTDLTALSAFSALVCDMGYQNEIVSLSRHELWLAEVDGEYASVRDRISQALDESLRFANPNKQSFEIRAGSESLFEPQSGGTTTLLVMNAVDNDGALIKKNLEESHDLEFLGEVSRVVLWRIGVSTPLPVERMASIVKFFANSSYQAAFMCPEPVTPDSIRGAISSSVDARSSGTLSVRPISRENQRRRDSE